MDNKRIDYSGDCEYCAICGAPIPEGSQLCASCLEKLESEDGEFDF